MEKKKCPDCNGTGRCRVCSGTGRHMNGDKCNNCYPGVYSSKEQGSGVCATCQGKGEV